MPIEGVADSLLPEDAVTFNMMPEEDVTGLVLPGDDTAGLMLPEEDMTGTMFLREVAGSLLPGDFPESMIKEDKTTNSLLSENKADSLLPIGEEVGSDILLNTSEELTEDKGFLNRTNRSLSICSLLQKEYKTGSLLPIEGEAGSILPIEEMAVVLLSIKELAGSFLPTGRKGFLWS
jgi:hypothetical protein